MCHVSLAVKASHSLKLSRVLYTYIPGSLLFLVLRETALQNTHVSLDTSYIAWTLASVAEQQLERRNTDSIA